MASVGRLRDSPVRVLCSRQAGSNGSPGFVSVRHHLWTRRRSPSSRPSGQRLGPAAVGVAVRRLTAAGAALDAPSPAMKGESLPAGTRCAASRRGRWIEMQLKPAPDTPAIPQAPPGHPRSVRLASRRPRRPPARGRPPRGPGTVGRKSPTRSSDASRLWKMASATRVGAKPAPNAATSAVRADASAGLPRASSNRAFTKPAAVPPPRTWKYSGEPAISAAACSTSPPCMRKLTKPLRPTGSAGRCSSWV